MSGRNQNGPRDAGKMLPRRPKETPKSDLNERAQSRWLSGCWQDAFKTAERNVEERFKRAGAIKMALVKICGNAEGRFKRAGAVKKALLKIRKNDEVRFKRAGAIRMAFFKIRKRRRAI